MARVLGFLIYVECGGQLDEADIESLLWTGIRADETYQDIVNLKVGALGEVTVDKDEDE